MATRLAIVANPGGGQRWAAWVVVLDVMPGEVTQHGADRHRLVRNVRGGRVPDQSPQGPRSGGAPEGILTLMM